MTTKKLDYEELKGELDIIITELQSEEVRVEDAMRAYQRGMELIEALEAYLKTAENKIIKIKAKFDV